MGRLHQGEWLVAVLGAYRIEAAAAHFLRRRRQQLELSRTVIVRAQPTEALFRRRHQGRLWRRSHRLELVQSELVFLEERLGAGLLAQPNGPSMPPHIEPTVLLATDIFEIDEHRPRATHQAASSSFHGLRLPQSFRASKAR